MKNSQLNDMLWDDNLQHNNAAFLLFSDQTVDLPSFVALNPKSIYSCWRCQRWIYAVVFVIQCNRTTQLYVLIVFGSLFLSEEYTLIILKRINLLLDFTFHSIYDTTICRLIVWPNILFHEGLLVIVALQELQIDTKKRCDKREELTLVLCSLSGDSCWWVKEWSIVLELTFLPHW